ncbi:Protein F13D2.1 a, partial [Aphelenchoides avenae]
IPGRLDIGLEAPHSVTQWTFNGHFWSPGRTGTCRVPAQAVVSLRHVFMDVDLPLHVYENETVQVRITVTADNISYRKRMAVCFKGLSPVVCGDVGPDGELGETDYTRVVLSPQQPVVVKNFYIKFLQTGMHNLSFELREESNFPGGDWHCRDSSVEVFDRIRRQVKVDQRVDVEEHFRQVIIYRQKRIIRPEGGAAALAMRKTLSPEIIDYTQSYPDDDTIFTGIKVNTAEKMYNFAMEFSKYVPSFPPGLSSEIISSKGRRNRRSKRDLSFGQTSYSLANVLKELSYATYELKSLKTFRSTVAQSELDDRETNIGNLLSELLTFSNCTSSKSNCAFGEFTRPSTYGSQPNLLLTSLATSVLCQQRASEEYVCGPLDFLAQHIEASSISSDDYSAYVNFQTQQKAWSKLYESFYAVSDSVHLDLRTEAALAYSSTAVTRGLMRHRLANRAKSDRLPYWSMERESNDILDSNLIRSGNILSNSLALLAFTANESVYAFWRAHFDFDTLSAWLVEEQTSSRQFENAIDTFFGCKALFQYQLRQTPTAVYESLVANISSPGFSDIRFDNTQMPFSMSIPTDTKTVTLTTKGDGRMLVGVRVLTERRKRSRRTGGAGGGYPVTIEMQQSRDAASGMIRQTVTLTPHSVMLKTLEVEHGVFTGFTTEPHLVQILDNATHFLVEPRISSTAVHFVLTNLMHNHGAKYVVVVKEPTTSYSPENLAPVAIIAKYNVILGQLIVSPSTLDFGTIALVSIRRKREAAISRYQLMRSDAGAGDGVQPAHANDQADLVDTVCLPNGACTCAEITCAMRCSNCSMLTFEALCEELQDKQHFGAIFRINGKNTTTVNHATYDVYDARIIDWYGKGDAPTQLSIWLRTCNSQCLRMVNGDANGNGKPRYLLIGNAEGIFDGSRMAPSPTETNALSTDLLRKHYVMRDNDRLARTYARHEKKGNTAVTIGLNNVLQPDRRTWRWEWVDGSTATFTNWEYGNPVEADPNAPTQNCAAMSLRDGQWFSDYKWNIATPVCERRPNY